MPRRRRGRGSLALDYNHVLNLKRNALLRAQERMPPRKRAESASTTPVSSVSSEAEDSRSNDRPDSNNAEEINPIRSGQGSRQLRRLDNGNAGKFLENWTPESSNRETRKLTRKIYKEGGRKWQSYNEQGIFIKSNSDFCDCLEETCPGCHFPCLRCTSAKCGHECRNNRKWTYDYVEIEGADYTIRNPHK
uniref:ARF7 effector protein C-terminal domain-containing protein n=1 Tax=Strigamia maritima TaxID=126957 RepID=T1JDY0_STRMM